MSGGCAMPAGVSREVFNANALWNTRSSILDARDSNLKLSFAI
jgi:hypothetical protein